MRTGTGAAGFDAKWISASGEKSREEEESWTLADTDEARFDWLLRAVASEPEALGWIEVVQPDTDRDGVDLLQAWLTLHLWDVVPQEVWPAAAT